jgi:hypothetical protein
MSKYGYSPYLEGNYTYVQKKKEIILSNCIKGYSLCFLIHYFDDIIHINSKRNLNYAVE